jgi:hypothetical protein
MQHDCDMRRGKIDISLSEIDHFVMAITAGEAIVRYMKNVQLS